MTTTQKLTLEQFLTLPEEKPHSEYADGRVIQKSWPDTPHSFIQGYLSYRLSTHVRRTGSAVVGVELHCIFGAPGRERVLCPDVAVVAREKLPKDPLALREYHKHAPDLAAEVTVADDCASWLADKVQFYLLHGTRVVWVADPASETVRIFEPGRDPRTLLSGDDLDGGDFLPKLHIPVRDIFAEMTLEPEE